MSSPDVDTLARGLDTRAAVNAFLVVALCVALVLAVFWPTTLSMVEIWRRSETFQHCFVVIPIALWLVWNDRVRLAATNPRPFWPGLLAVAALGFVWLFGVLSAAQVVSQFAVIGLVSALVLTLFGTAWAKQLWFPLVFLFFAVPFGEAIVPRLMDWTADFTVAGLRLSGVPVYREGMHFVIPTGQWSVIEACSGIKFLIASLMAGSLYAWLMYRSPARRAAFLLASILVPLAANWLRAYSIVMIGHLSHNRLMTNEDHIVFGWVLFGAIMMLLYWLGARWREDRPEGIGPSVAAASRWQPGRVAPAATVVALSLLVWPALGHQFMRPVGQPGRVEIRVPDPLLGWERQDGMLASWSPDLEGANATQVVVYRKGSHAVALVVAAYRHQTQMAQVGSSANQFVHTTNAAWKQTARGREDMADLRLATVPRATNTAELRGLQAQDPLLVWQWYWAGDAATASPARTKLELARSRLLRQTDTALWVAVYTPINERAEARRVLQAFLREMDPSLKHAFSGTVAQ